MRDSSLFRLVCSTKFDNARFHQLHFTLMNRRGKKSEAKLNLNSDSVSQIIELGRLDLSHLEPERSGINRKYNERNLATIALPFRALTCTHRGTRGPMVGRLTSDQKIQGSSPCAFNFLFSFFDLRCDTWTTKRGSSSMQKISHKNLS